MQNIYEIDAFPQNTRHEDPLQLVAGVALDPPGVLGGDVPAPHQVGGVDRAGRGQGVDEVVHDRLGHRRVVALIVTAKAVADQVDDDVDIESYRRLPEMLYQIQTKYRDEARPRFGLMRSREFIMKDCYSFDMDEAGLDHSYRVMYDAYDRIFKRCALSCRAVEADNGAIGGSKSHEFTAISEVGESEIAYCEKCSMAATVERAECVDADADSGLEMLPLEEVNTPGTETIEEVAAFLDLDKKQTIKALLFVKYDENGDEDGYVAAFVRGDRELNMTKLVNALGIAEHRLEFADEEKMGKLTGAVGGFKIWDWIPFGFHN